MSTLARIFGIGTLFGLITALCLAAEARQAYQAPQLIIRRMLLEEPNSWNWQIVESFTEKLPERIAIPLANQSAESIHKFIVSQRSPFRTRGLDRVTVCLASVGEGGSYLAVISHNSSEYPIIFDTLMPPSLLRPQITFVDLDGDSIPEIICDGITLHSNRHEWAIVSWGLSGGYLMAPRLDQASKSLHHNRLIGMQLNVLPERDDGALRLELVTGDLPQGWVIKHVDESQRRIFRFHRDIGGYLPND